MSRIGKLPIQIPENVTVKKDDGRIKVSVKDSEMSVDVLKDIEVEIGDKEITVIPKSKTKQARSNWGTTRALIANAVKGLTEGFQKTLLLEGVGYRMKEEGDGLKMTLGFSHGVEFKKPKGIEFELDGTNKLTIKGYDKQQVGEIAAEIRSLRPVEPYKGKGFRYSDEIVRRKAGKKATTGE